MKNIKYSCIGSYYLGDHFKKSHPWNDKCPIVVSNEEIEFMKSSRHKDEDKTSTGKQKESV
jgi:hypothetical protein